MQGTEFYRTKAQECGRLAAHARTTGEMAALMKRGQEWLILAERDQDPSPPRISEPISFKPIDAWAAARYGW
jgi:hypothetical protein